MKKGWKIFWIVCGVLTICGIMLIAAGAAFGGLRVLKSDADEVRMRTFLEGFTDTHHTVADVDGDTVTEFSGIDELDIELTGLGVRVQPHDGDGIVVDTTDCRQDLQDKINVWQEDSELKVEMEDRGRLRTENSGIMYILVPRGTRFDKISAEAVAGLIEIEGIEASKMSVSADAGQIVMDSFYTEHLEADCGVGEIVLNGEVTEKAEIDCDLGDIQCTFPGAPEAYDYEVDCDLGDVIIDGESYSSFHHRIKAENGSGCKIKADCNLGSIEIAFE